MATDRILAWVNGRLGLASAPTLSVLDHGFTVGDGVFETLKVSEGQPFALTRHLQRLARSAELLGLKLPATAEIRSGVAAVLAESEPMAQARLRITLTAGPGPLGSDRLSGPTTLAVVLAPAAPRLSSAAVVTVPWSRNERGALVGVKSTSYAENVVALSYATTRNASEALCFNTRDELCEGTGSNVVLVLGEEVITPPLTSGCLPGITRELLLEWAAAAGVQITERAVNAEELRQASEVMLTSSTRDVQAVHAVDGRTLPVPGPRTKELAEIFRVAAARTIDP